LEKSMKILVTGAAGHLGSKIAAHLLTLDHDVSDAVVHLAADRSPEARYRLSAQYPRCSTCPRARRAGLPRETDAGGGRALDVDTFFAVGFETVLLWIDAT
jgi:uncharacterized protein YbjT (DUF2867 family)